MDECRRRLAARGGAGRDGDGGTLRADNGGEPPHSHTRPLAHSPVLTRFDWHVLRRFASGAALLMGLLVATFVVLDLAERIDDFLDRGATTAQIFGEYYLYYIPDILRLTSPLALFLAAVYVTARLAQSMELTAVHMAGVSTWRYMRPIVLAGAVWTAGMLAFNGFVVPKANAVVHAFQNRYYRDAPEQGSGSEIVRQVGPGVVLTARYFDRERDQAFRVSVVGFDSAGIARRFDASQMTYVDTLGTWQVADVAVRTFGPEGEQYAYFAELDTVLSVLPRDLAQSERDAERLTLPEARAYVTSLERAGVTERGRPLVAYHTKIAYPFANLILVLLAVPMAAKRRRGGQAVQLALGLGVAFLYLALQRRSSRWGSCRRSRRCWRRGSPTPCSPSSRRCFWFAPSDRPGAPVSVARASRGTTNSHTCSWGISPETERIGASGTISATQRHPKVAFASNIEVL